MRIPWRQFFPILALSLSLGFVGCSSVPKRDAPQLGKSEVRETAPLAEIPAWWREFGDPGLNRAVETALEGNPDLDSAAARIREARELAQAQRAEGLPRANLGAGFTQGRESNRETAFRNVRIDPWRAAATASWEIDLFGRIAARSRSATENLRQREADLQAVQLALSAEVAVAWFTLLRLNEEREIVAELLESSEEIAETTRNREQAGLASTAETGRQEAETETLRGTSIEIDRQREVAAIRLDVLKGQHPGTSAPPQKGLSTSRLFEKVPRQVPLEWIRQRPDLLAAEAAVFSSYAQEQADRLNLYPALTMELDGIAMAGSLSGPVGAWLAGGGPRLQLPVLDPTNRARARATQARTDAAVAAWETALLAAFEELEIALIDVAHHRRQFESVRRETAQWRDVWKTTRTNFAAGVVSHVEVLDDQRSYLAARRSELALRHLIVIDQVAIAKAVGGKID